MNTCPLQSALDMLLPAVMRPDAADEARWAFNAAQRQKRAEHVAWRTPQLFAQYGCDPAKLSDALDDANDVKRCPQVFTALATGDDIEAMRLLRRAINARLQALAEDAADEEAWDRYDDRTPGAQP